MNDTLTEIDPDQDTLLESSDIDGTTSKENGNVAEEWAKSKYDLDDPDPERFPESCHDAIDPRTGTPIEIKSCVLRYTQSGDRGRWQIWDYAHELLLDADGAYIFIVHEPRADEFTVYLHRPLSAADVDALIPTDGWYPINHSLRPDAAHRYDLSQSRVFTDIHVDRIEIEDTQPDDVASIDDVEDRGPPQQKRIDLLKTVIDRLEAEHQGDPAPLADVVRVAAFEHNIPPDVCEQSLDNLKRHGEIYEPRRDHLRTI